MKKNLIISGTCEYGKTALLINCLGDKLSVAGGYVTESIRNNDGSIMRYELLPSAATAGVEGFVGECFLDISVKPPFHNTEVFRNTGTRLLMESEFFPYTVIAEFGGFEILVPQFREALLDALSGSQPCLCALISLPEAKNLKKTLKLGSRYIETYKALTTALKKHSETEILELNKRNEMDAVRAAQRWIKEYVE